MIKIAKEKGNYVVSIYKDTFKWNGKYKNWSLHCFGAKRFKTFRKAINFARGVI